MKMPDRNELEFPQPQTIPGYIILNEIGKGATGVVFAARDTSSARLLAVKIMYAYYSRNREVVRRFTREAELTKRLRHPNIVEGIDYGFHQGHHYFIMEYVRGKTLKELIIEQKPLPETQVVEITLEVARGLQFAHQHSIVHRDIKPANIIVTDSGQVKLMDFGLAKEELDSSLTMQGTIVGTPIYISPEQAQGRPNVDIRTDIYSLGITMYHLAVGEPPFADLNTPVLLTKKITDEIPCPREKHPQLSDGICYIIEQMCHSQPGLRYQNPDELIQDLEAFQAGTLAKKPSRIERRIAPSLIENLDELKSLVKDEQLRTLLLKDELPVKPLRVQEKEVLFYEEDTSTEVYILLAGKLEVLKAGRRVGTIEKVGAFFGEMSLLLGVPRTATVRVLDTAVVLQIKEADFRDFIARSPGMAYNMAIELANRLKQTTDDLKEAQSCLVNLKTYIEMLNQEITEGLGCQKPERK